MCSEHDMEQYRACTDWNRSPIRQVAKQHGPTYSAPLKVGFGCFLAVRYGCEISEVFETGREGAGEATVARCPTTDTTGSRTAHTTGNRTA